MPKTTPAHKALIRRYLTWAYKSTKESFDRLERKTTQLLADGHILRELLKQKGKGREYAALVGEYKDYISKKAAAPVPEAQYTYLKNRLFAVEKTIVHFLGRKELERMRAAYEEEFTQRIWESKEH